MEKSRLYEYIDSRRGEIIERGRRFFDCAELGFKEEKTMDMICTELDELGVPYEKGIAMTGVKATIGKGKGIISALRRILMRCPERMGRAASIPAGTASRQLWG